MKAISPQITHKSMAGGVILNVWSPEEAKAFFDELAEKVKNYDLIHKQNFKALLFNL